MAAATASSDSQAATAAHSSGNPRIRHAVKTALALTLAYLLPMALGWPQPQTAATTVMLIAAAGLVSESLQKGVLRIVGTVAGAGIGLTLIAVFPQERWLYLSALSVLIALVVYCHQAYRGDSTAFMLTAVVMMMVFNGGDAEGAFVYGIDRSFMTVFGVLVYTLVASLLWPVKAGNDSARLAQNTCGLIGKAAQQLTGTDSAQREQALAEAMQALEALMAQLASARDDADGLRSYEQEWQAIVGSLRQLEAQLAPALQQSAELDWQQHMGNHDEILAGITQRFAALDKAWQGSDPGAPEPVVPPQYQLQAQHSHQLNAALASRAQLLSELQHTLIELQQAVRSLHFERQSLSPTSIPAQLRFNWLQRSNLEAALRVFCCFWLSALVWIQFNPPGGFTFVAMCTALAILVSAAPIAPKVLMILFTLGFVFAAAAYVFLLPQLTHWGELALFLFAYAFIGFYVFQGPVSLFFLLGLFTLGIQNEMQYSMAALLSIMLMFYLICAVLVVAVYWPYDRRPQRLYRAMQRQFFHNSAALLKTPLSTRYGNRLRLVNGDATIIAMRDWGSRIQCDYFDDLDSAALTAFNHRCDLLQGQLRALQANAVQWRHNQLVAPLARSEHSTAVLCRLLATGDARAVAQFDRIAEERRNTLHMQLDQYLSQDCEDDELAEFYRYLQLQLTVFGNLLACRDAQRAIPWQQLGENRY
jgi:uncharacterized membrane protein YccC